MYASNKKVDITLPSGRVFTVCAEDWEDAGAAICCDLLTDEDIDDIAHKLDASAKANPHWSPYKNELWRDYENITIDHKVFYFEDMTDDEYDRYCDLCDKKDEAGVKALCEQVYNRIKKKENL